MACGQAESGTIRQLIAKVLALAIVVSGACYAIVEFTPYLRLFGHERVLYIALHRAQQKFPEAKVVVLGDSVCCQLYKPNSYRKEIVSLASNYGVSLLGQRILMDIWLEHNSDAGPQDIALVVNPESFRNSLNETFTYGYVIKPFWCPEWRNRFDDVESRRIKAFRFYWLSQFPYVRISDWCPSEIPSFAQEPHFKECHLSQISIYELKKMEESARRHGVRLHILAGVVRESTRTRDFGVFKRQIKEGNLEALFSEYFPSAKYLPDQLFLDDVRARIHLKDPEALGRDALGLLKLAGR